MGPEMQLKLDPFWRSVSASEQAALLLDYDGTLAPFHSQRDLAFPYPGVGLILQEIIRSGHTRVVVITGRDATDLLPLLNVHPRPEIWGVYGLQRLATDGTAEVPNLDERTLNALSDAEGWLEREQLRQTAEFKQGGIAVHWRGLGDLAVKYIRSQVLEGWRPIAEHSGLDLLDFDGGIEIRAREADKGDAVRSFLNEIGPLVPIAYLGDDSADEAAFHAIGHRGITALVRPEWRPTCAEFWLKPPEEVLAFLRIWLASSAVGDAVQGGAKAVTK